MFPFLFAIFNDTWVLTNATGIPTGQLGITQLLPNHGGTSGQVTVRVIGSGFQSGASVKLTGSRATSRHKHNSCGRIPADHDLRSYRGRTGSRTVVVTNLDNSTVSLPSGFTVEQGGVAQFWVDIIGRDKIRIGREQTFYVSFGNRGNLDVSAVPIWIQVPRNVSIKLVSDWPPHYLDSQHRLSFRSLQRFLLCMDPSKRVWRIPIRWWLGTGPSFLFGFVRSLLIP